MKILITGANGFVGSHLCEELLKSGHEIFALVRSPKKFTELVDVKDAKHGKLTIIKGDLGEHDDSPLSWVESLPHDLDVCVHTAGIVHSYNTDDFYRINAGGTQNLANSLKARFINLHFVLVSSLAAAGPSQKTEKRNEADLDFPVSIYGRSKKRAEELLYKNAPKTWTITVVRPPMVIGPRDSAVLDIFKMVQGRVILLPGSDSRTKLYSFVCVFDLVETIKKLIEKKETGLFYSAYPEVISFEEIISEIKNQMKKKWIFFLPFPLFIIRIIALFLHFFYKLKPHGLRLTPDKFHELKASNWTCDGSKSEEILSQVYLYNLERTITLTLIDYKSRNWL